LPLKASRKEQRSVIRFLWAIGLAQMPFTVRCDHAVYDDRCFTRPAVHVWCKMFAHGRENVVDEERPGRYCFNDGRSIQGSQQSILSCGLTGV